MKKTGYYLLSLLFVIVAIAGLLLMQFSGYAIIITIIAVPLAFVTVILGVSAGQKEGDIPFVGY